MYSGLNSESNTEEFTIPSKLQFESSVNSKTIFEKKDAPQEKSMPVYQLQRKYLVTSIKSGLVVVHQNRAHQRVLYEDFRKQISLSNSVSQQLLFPLELSFSTTEITFLKTLEQHLVQTGFAFTDFKKDSVSIIGIPTVITESEVSIILEQLFEDFQNEVPETSFSQIDTLAKSLAKSAAIKTGVIMDEQEQQHLVNKLFACEEPNCGPNRKKTFITLGVDELDKKF